MSTSALALLGDDLVRIREHTERAVSGAVTKEFRAFNFQQFGPGDGSPATIADAIAAYPFGTGRRVVLVRELGAFPDPWPEEIARLAEDLAARDEGASLFIVSAPGLDRRKRPARILEGLGKLPAGESVTYPSPKPWKLDDWVSERARERGIPLERGAAAVLVDLVGEDLMVLDGELTKLVLFTGGERALGVPDIEAVTGRTRGEIPWELPRLLLGGDGPGAERLLERLLASGERPHFLVQVLTRGVLDAYRLRLLLDEGRRESDAAAELGLKDFVARRMLPLARRCDGPAFARMLEVLKDCDRELKRRSGQDEGLLHEAAGRLALLAGAVPGRGR